MGALDFKKKDFFTAENELNQGIVMLNPPYGERLNENDINEFYTKLGDTFKKNYQNFSVWLISSNMEALKKVGLRANKKLTVFNGPLECKLLKFEMYQGSKKHT